MPNIKERIAKFCITYRVVVVTMLVILTGYFLYNTTQVSFTTVFQDLLPSDHPYIKVNAKYTEQFGGPNMVSIRIHAKEGDIFNHDVLQVVQKLQNDLRYVTAVNQFQIISLASKKLKRTVATTERIESLPLMWPHVPETRNELDILKQAVIENPLVYGSYVSRDLKSALVTIDFIDRLVDYDAIFDDINAIIDKIDTSKVTVAAVGDPILRGIVNSYLPETLFIFAGSILAMCVILFFAFMRTWRGTLIPLLNAIISGIWALGIGHLFGLDLDPLGIVITFLITARVISHSVQSVTRFEEVVSGHELVKNGNQKDISKIAAEVTLGTLLRPGLLSVVTDAGGILVVALAPIPLLQKTALLGAIWVSCILITGVIMTPVLLSWVRKPNNVVFPLNVDKFYSFLLRKNGAFVLSKYRWGVIGFIGLVFTIGLYYASTITVGDAHSGTPLLWPQSDYNQAEKVINDDFLGTNRMFVVIEGERNDILKEPKILENLRQFQRHVELQPKLGGSISIADLIPNVRRILFEGNPRYEQIGDSKASNGEFLFLYLASSEPGDLSRFSDDLYKNGAVTMFLQDHKGETIRNTIAWINDFIKANPIEGIEYKLAGGLIGLLAAINEVIFAGQVESIAFALLVVLFTSTITYRSSVSGLFFMVPILISNILTFNYMAFKGIGLNINTLPVAALGIGLGVDYAIYVVDSIKGYFEYSNNVEESIYYGLKTAGRGVVNTATPLIMCTTIWFFLSSLRFQAEMAILIAIWMGISALCALIVMPSMIYIFRPRFVFGNPKS